MTATYFQDFTRDNGLPVTVEYSFSQGSDTACVEIVEAWPNTPEFDALCQRRNDIRWARSRPPLWQSCTVVWLNLRIWFAGRAARLTDAERERMETWLIEHHEYEPYYPDWEDAL
ncbi:hypothetical protein [Mesorhizobium sp.]|uniref:hypothetical protein n=1 Tax=Mesorhizobium sp. TaxID=1871066 RepID=UPI000FE7A5B2|nr:hypothetical protein [Mesorhizobium sp.]RWO23321.1 MAG: hypothetical protein EOS09_16985 [Mesorhizobium sp.]